MKLYVPASERKNLIVDATQIPKQYRGPYPMERRNTELYDMEVIPKTGERSFRQDYFVNPIGTDRANRVWGIKNEADTNMFMRGHLSRDVHFLVLGVRVEKEVELRNEKLATTFSRFIPLNHYGYFKFIIGQRVIITYPLNIGSAKMDAIYIPPECSFQVHLVLLNWDEVSPVRVRLQGVQINPTQ